VRHGQEPEPEIGPEIDPEAVAGLIELGERRGEVVGGMFDDDPDLCIER